MAIPDSANPGYKALRGRIDEALDLLAESPAVDFKESQDWATLKFTIIKCVLGMGNLRDGGLVLIGVSERNKSWSIDGVSVADLATYDADDMLDAIHAYVSPSVDVHIVTHNRGGAKLLALRIFQFADLPLVCRKSRDDHGLLKGGIYIRPPGKPQTRRVESAQELLDVLEVAAEIRARKMIGIRDALTPEAGNADLFDAELGDL